MMKYVCVTMLLFYLPTNAPLAASDWTRFRGPEGAGISADASAPVTWSESKNLKWITALPGAGSSSPIVVGDRVFVTCFSGEAESLKRHLLCVNRSDGEVAWSKTVDAERPEDDYRGYLTEHGYRSDGQHLSQQIAAKPFVSRRSQVMWSTANDFAASAVAADRSMRRRSSWAENCMS